MQIGKTKDQGLYNKPSDAVLPGPLAAGTLPQYNTISSIQCACFVILYSVACLAVPYFSTLCHKRRDIQDIIY